MIRMLLLLLPLLWCTGCTALPAEERAFAVALCVEQNEAWRVHARIPTYQSGGGYLTVSGEGETLAAAMTDMDGAAPMHINLSQLRLLVLAEDMAASGGLTEALQTLSRRQDMRLQCAVALSGDPLKQAAEALVPEAGARLSKALELLLDARIEQGGILPVTLAEIIRKGERQAPVLIRLKTEDRAIRLEGGYPMTGQLKTGTALTMEETALLSMLLGKTKALRLTLPGGGAQVRDISAGIRLTPDLQTGRVSLKLRTTDSGMKPEEMEACLAEQLLTLLTRLSAEGCDVLGLGGKVMMRMHDMNQWHALNWPERYRSIRWMVSVKVIGPA